MARRKSNVVLLESSTAPYWRYTCSDGEIAIYMPRGGKLTIERANILLDYAKQELLDKSDKGN